MRRIRVVDRRALIEHYLSIERLKRRDLPVDLSGLDFADPNELDGWLKAHDLKVGVLSGFMQWAFVDLEPHEIRQCAVVASIADEIGGPSTSQNLGALEQTPRLKSWTPRAPGHYWDGRMGAGSGIPEEWAIILRPALPSPPSNEHSRFYVEDGSGRLTQLVQRSDKREHAFAFIGFEPDKRSLWLFSTWNGYFIVNRHRYETEEDALGQTENR